MDKRAPANGLPAYTKQKLSVEGERQLTTGQPDLELPDCSGRPAERGTDCGQPGTGGLIDPPLGALPVHTQRSPGVHSPCRHQPERAPQTEELKCPSTTKGNPRHPHVFGNEHTSDAGSNVWQTRKDLSCPENENMTRHGERGAVRSKRRESTRRSLGISEGSFCLRRPDSGEQTQPKERRKLTGQRDLVSPATGAHRTRCPRKRRRPLKPAAKPGTSLRTLEKRNDFQNSFMPTH